ncbi:recombinase family protein [Kitasatospora sp. NPDC059673]|uniref:recombinase family protein n=1 Tax=Kitasatospora sp. NPDC059673 TaxID=3346901 RepID=UPI0036CBE90F
MLQRNDAFSERVHPFECGWFGCVCWPGREGATRGQYDDFGAGSGGGWFACLGHARAGREIVGSFEDLDLSAEVTPWKRPDLGPWLTDRQGEWDALDRAFRSAKDCADVAHWAEENHKVLVFTDDGITLDYRKGRESSFGNELAKVFLMLASIFAEMELKRIKARVAGAHQASAKDGPVGGRSAAVRLPDRRPARRRTHAGTGPDHLRSRPLHGHAPPAGAEPVDDRHGPGDRPLRHPRHPGRCTSR